ncbi:carbohydrate ABC transporter membrane protein 2 (CUT1 family) [Hydrogenispora ethanolica]|jgi:multiple sugar transport system permease protein|uniref:Carbohydrate ABC transporter membrane protein 2 (CUT1 family) n=1 Tax=Hydrogenispora ethanolica TaxID=1082276 RepID=A0A4R1RW21_HYDET|nr:carbohydrate ABC transporter permease [Hydrogenispora ethanolica]TCL70868.1 carbohydrate ABC transporter membrane protein 2 (CUT1 family) [Hydrogenispora ethanolica]
MRSSSPKHWLKQSLLYLSICVILFAYLFPLFWQFSTSLKESGEVFAGYNLIPKKVVWDSYATAWSTFNIRQYLFNTVVVAAIVTFGTLLSCAMAGYAFARLRFPGRDFIFYLYLGTMMVPGAVTLIPAYYVILKLNLANSYFALIIPFIFGNAFGTFLMRQYYLTIPKDLAESATIDGAGYLRTWWSIMLPLSKPTLATLGVMTLVAQWNSFIWPLVVTQNPALKVLAVGLSDFRLYRNIQWNALMAAVMIAIVPMLVILALAQKLFIKGIQFSGVNR